MQKLGTIILYALAFAPLAANAQTQPPPDSQRVARNVRMLQLIQGFQMASSPELGEAVNSLLKDDATHMHMGPRRPLAPGDSARAADIVTTAKAALAKYSDVNAAVADGYIKFLPSVEDQIVFHYNSIGNVMAMRNGFDVTRPVSLLYKKDEMGMMKLVGAMYNAMPSATPEELDARLPTSIAQWHEHVDFCSASPDSVMAGVVKLDGPTIARWLKITTRDECTAVGGRFIPRMFGWMAHVYLFASDDPKVIWGEGHGSMDVHLRHPPPIER
jgi:hypothetical protein